MRGSPPTTRVALGLLWLTLALLTLGQSPPAPGSGPPAPGSPPGSAPTAVPPGLNLPPGANLAIIDIDGMIYGYTVTSTRRRVDRALDHGASVIVFRMNTNGGYVTAGLDLAKYIKSIPVPTVAWVDNKAYSAGILVASACDQIVMAPASALGDCAPITPGQDMAPTERAKALSPLLEEFRDNARDNGYDYTLFHAMCVLGIEIYEVENLKTGDRELVNQADYAVMVQGADPDSVSPPGNNPAGGPGGTPGGGTSGGSAVVPPGAGPGAANAPVLDGRGVAVATLETATAKDRAKWKLVKKIHDGKTLLTLNQSRAKSIGLSSATVASEADLGGLLGARTVTYVQATWSEQLAGFLTNTIVRVILVVVLLLGTYLELQSPGLGVAGTLAALALIALLGAPLLIGLAEVWHIVVFVLGLGLLILELAFTPTFGLMGVAGIVLMFVGLVLSVVPTSGGYVPTGVMMNRLLTSTVSTLGAVLLSFVGFYFLSKYFGQIPFLSRLILVSDGGDQAIIDAPSPVQGEDRVGGGTSGSTSEGGASGGGIRVGDTGRVIGVGLYPSGRADFNGRPIDVVSPGSHVPPGSVVRVLEVHGNRIVVDQPHP